MTPDLKRVSNNMFHLAYYEPYSDCYFRYVECAQHDKRKTKQV